MSRYIHLEDCTLITVSDKAVCVEYNGERHWLPFSQLASDEEEKIQNLLEKEAPCRGVTLSVTAWICEKKGIETDE